MIWNFKIIFAVSQSILFWSSDAWSTLIVWTGAAEASTPRMKINCTKVRADICCIETQTENLVTSLSQCSKVRCPGKECCIGNSGSGIRGMPEPQR